MTPGPALPSPLSAQYRPLSGTLRARPPRCVASPRPNCGRPPGGPRGGRRAQCRWGAPLSAPKLACQPATWALGLGAQLALDPNRAVVLGPRRAPGPGIGPRQSRRPAAGAAPGVTLLSWRRRRHAPPAGKKPYHPGRAAAAAAPVSSSSWHDASGPSYGPGSRRAGGPAPLGG